MTMKSMKRLSQLLAIFLWMSVAGVAGAMPTHVATLFVFSDSLFDNGNSGLVSQDAVGILFPPPPYFEGRFSNGPVSSEYLWEILNPGDDSFAPSLDGGTNYAIGGATSGDKSFQSVNPNVPPVLQTLYSTYGNDWQLGAFDADDPAFDPDESLFLIWLGANDVFYHGATGQLPGTVPGSSGGSNIVENTLANTLATIEFLADRGARHFLVVNMPDLGAVPEFLGNTDLTSLSILFNSSLSVALDVLDATRQDIDIRLFDVFTAMNEIIADPAANALTVVDQSCLDNLISGVCNAGNWDEWLFWDGAHPTTRGHQLIAERLAEEIRSDNGPPQPPPAPIPTASDWIMILFAMLIMGLVWRERRYFKRPDVA